MAKAKSGVFEDDVRSGYYEDCAGDFQNDHVKWLEEQGVPKQYAGKVASHAWQEGHSSGFSEVLNVSYDLVEIFTYLEVIDTKISVATSRNPGDNKLGR